MAKLLRSIDKLEDVDEKYRALYTEQESGSFVLDDDVQAAGEDIKELRTRLDEFRKNNNASKDQIEKLQDSIKAAEEAKKGDEAKAKTEAERIAALEERATKADQAAAAATAKANDAAKLGALEKAGIAQGVDRKAVGRFANAFADQLDVDENDSVVVKGDAETSVTVFVTKSLIDEPFWTAASKGDGGNGDGDENKQPVRRITDAEYQNADEATHKGGADGSIEVDDPE